MGLESLLELMKNGVAGVSENPPAGEAATPETPRVAPGYQRKPAPMLDCTRDIPDTSEIADTRSEAQPRRRAWLLHYADREPVECHVTPAATHAEMLAANPDALAAEPIRDLAGREPVGPLSAEDEAAIRAWLAGIGEADAAMVAEMIEQRRSGRAARAHFLGRTAAPSPEPDDRRTCRQCANLCGGGLCLAARVSEQLDQDGDDADGRSHHGAQLEDQAQFHLTQLAAQDQFQILQIPLRCQIGRVVCHAEQHTIMDREGIRRTRRGHASPAAARGVRRDPRPGIRRTLRCGVSRGRRAMRAGAQRSSAPETVEDWAGQA
jgi:hypothetical protein